MAVNTLIGNAKLGITRLGALLTGLFGGSTSQNTKMSCKGSSQPQYIFNNLTPYNYYFDTALPLGRLIFYDSIVLGGELQG
jgi:hypothetical protein